MVAAILIAGIWGIWKALVQRRYTETAGALAISVLFVRDRAVLRLPARAHDRAGVAVDEHALAGVSLRRQPRLARRPRAGQAPGRRPPVRDAGLRAVGGAASSAGSALRRHRPPRRRTASPARSARTTRPATSAATTCEQDRDGHGGYAQRYLRQPPGSEERKAEYDALREGQAPADPAVRRLRGRQGRRARGRRPAGRRRVPAADVRRRSCSPARSARSCCSASSRSR